MILDPASAADCDVPTPRSVSASGVEVSISATPTSSTTNVASSDNQGTSSTLETLEHASDETFRTVDLTSSSS